jgi:hypothetical protein
MIPFAPKAVPTGLNQVTFELRGFTVRIDV